MKKILFIPILLVCSLAIGQPVDSASIIGKPKKLGNLLIAQYDFEKRMNWNDAIKACSELGKGWRLPTKEEFNKLTIKRFDLDLWFNRRNDGDYWTSPEHCNYHGWAHKILGSQYYCDKAWLRNVRAVRTF